MVGARFQRHVERGTTGGFPGLPERQHLGMLGSGLAVPPRADHPAPGGDHRPHGGVGTGPAETLPGQAEGQAHQRPVVPGLGTRKGQRLYPFTTIWFWSLTAALLRPWGHVQFHQNRSQDPAAAEGWEETT